MEGKSGKDWKSVKPKRSSALEGEDDYGVLTLSEHAIGAIGADDGAQRTRRVVVGLIIGD